MEIISNNSFDRRICRIVRGKGTHVNQAPRIMRGKRTHVNQASRIMRDKGTHVNQAPRIVRNKVNHFHQALIPLIELQKLWSSVTWSKIKRIENLKKHCIRFFDSYSFTIEEKTDFH